MALIYASRDLQYGEQAVFSAKGIFCSLKGEES